MTAISTQSQLSFQEYLNYDDGTDSRYELVNGELVEVPLASRRHWKISKFLERLFEKEVDRENKSLNVGRGDVGMRTRGGDRDNVRIPDVIVFDSANESDLEEFNVLTNSPLLVVEIVSPGKVNQERDYIKKRREYTDLGVLEYWIVDPQQQKITLLVLENSTYREQVYMGDFPLVSVVFPGLQLTADRIWSSYRSDE